MSKKIVAIQGSPHTTGNGAAALDCVLEGAAQNGAECIKYNLNKLNIKNDAKTQEKLRKIGRKL